MPIFNMTLPVYNSPYLLLVLNFLFLTVSNLVVVAISAKSFLKYGALNILLLSSALLISGLVSLIAGWTWAFSINDGVTIQDIGLFTSAGLQVMSAIVTLTMTSSSETSKRKVALAASYYVTVAFVAFLTLMTILNMMPPFFTETGSTLLRQLFLGMTSFFLSLSSVLFLWQYIQSKSEPLYWYSLALVLFAIGSLSFTFQTQNGDVYSWVGRLAQYIGGLYFLLALYRHKVGVGKEENLSELWAEAFSTNQKQLSDLFENMLNAFAYNKIITNKNGKAIDWVYLEVNRAFEKTFELKRKDVIGKRATEIFPEIAQDPADWIGVYGRVALTGKPVMFENYRQSQRKWYNVSVYCPKICFFVTFLEDITERKKAEEALKQSEERFRFVAEAANVLVYEYDVESGKIILARGLEELLGYKLEETSLTYNWWISQSHPDDVERIRAELKAVISDETAKGYVLEYRLRHKNGNYIIVKDTGKILRYDNTVHIIGGIRDITECKQLQEKLKDYAKHLEELVEERTLQLKDRERLATIGETAGMVGHDIRNPLQTIINELYIAKESIANAPEREEKKEALESIGIIQEQTDYISKIVSDLQDYARPLKPEYTEVDLSDLVTSVLLTVNIPDKIVLKVDTKGFPKIKTDPTFIRRILTNLANNAIQAMPNGGKLEMSAFEKDNKIIITVVDTGKGIPEEIKPKLFTPLVTTKAKGQGLGLAVVKRLVEALGGSIAFESEEDKGTKFTITLPA